MATVEVEDKIIYCDAEVFPGTYWEQPEYCDDEATVEDDEGHWCDAHADRWEPEYERDDWADDSAADDRAEQEWDAGW